MVSPISPQIPPAGSVPAATPSNPSSAGADAPTFATQLREQLEEVSRMQAEADQGVQKLVTGQTDDITNVLTTARKAEIAFGLLMEIRNKLVDAYVELRQIRV
jgi:flagellar hook-basal body complex protein FliE